MKFTRSLAVTLIGLSLLAAVPALAQSTTPAASSPPAATAPAATDSAAAPALTPAPDNAPAAAPVAATPAPALASDAAVTTQVANPYSLGALWAQGDFVAKGTLLVLAIFSAATWYILVTKLLEQGNLLRQAKAANQNFWKSASVSEGVATLPAKSPFHIIAATGVSALEHHEGSLVETIDLNTWVTLSIQRIVEQIVSRMQGGLAVLATVGSTAPFIGLFGTVWGIYHALTSIAIAGQASIDKVAGPVGEALIMTALGLATAVPAVLGYNGLVRRNKLAVEKVRGFASDLHSVLVSGKVIGPQSATVIRADIHRPTASARSA